MPDGGADGLLDAVVVDVGHSGTEIARVSGGRVVVACRVPVGGAVLDDVTAELLGGAARITGCGTGPRSGPRASGCRFSRWRGWVCRPSNWMPMHCAER